MVKKKKEYRIVFENPKSGTTFRFNGEGSTIKSAVTDARKKHPQAKKYKFVGYKLI